MKKKTKSKNTTNPKKKKKKKASETIWLSSYASANLVPKETKDEPRANQTLNHEWRMVSPRFRFPSMQTLSSDLINFQHFLHYFIFLSFFVFVENLAIMWSRFWKPATPNRAYSQELGWFFLLNFLWISNFIFDKKKVNFNDFLGF